MKLSANRFTRWFVQGERYSLESQQAKLFFKSKFISEEIPFALWNGNCLIERGLIWGKMSFEFTHLDGVEQKITVFGLPWSKINKAAYELTVEYKSWLTNQKDDLDKSRQTLIDLQSELYDHHGYLRVSDLLVWEKKATKKLQVLKIHPQTLSLLDPSLYQNFYAWLVEGEKRRLERNEWWFNKELKQWSPWFEEIESNGLNLSQQQAVLLGDNNNLILAGAGSGKTSVLVARCRYLVESNQCQSNQILLLAFGKKACEEMKQRLKKVGLNDIEVSTFHSFAIKVIKEIDGINPVISLLATDDKVKKDWLSNWLMQTFNHPTSNKRWTKHLEKWQIPGLNPKISLEEQISKTALHKWLWRQLDLLRQQHLPMSALKKLLINDPEALSEFTLLMPLVQQYLNHLSNEKEFDFHSLIERATDLLSKKSNVVTAQYDQILVDEYQDISPSRMALIEAICNVNRERKPSFYAVGDDWQAIYRFAGSDVNLITNFQKRFPNSNLHYLDTTYRFNSMLGEVANSFVLANPKQIEKKLHSFNMQKKKSVCLSKSSEIEVVLEELNSLISDKETSLMLIGRNNNNKPKSLSSWQSRWPKIKMQYVTAHASKGLEADYSFILDVNEGIFPARSKESGLEYSLLNDVDEIEFAEERRLFYVAITRAKHACWIFCDPTKASVFVQELSRGYPVIDNVFVKKSKNTVNVKIQSKLDQLTKV